MKGALEKILPQCTKYYENGQVYPLSQKKDQEFLTEAYDIGQQGLRGIARDSLPLDKSKRKCLRLRLLDA